MSCGCQLFFDLRVAQVFSYCGDFDSHPFHHPPPHPPNLMMSQKFREHRRGGGIGFGGDVVSKCRQNQMYYVRWKTKVTNDNDGCDVAFQWLGWVFFLSVSLFFFHMRVTSFSMGFSFSCFQFAKQNKKNWRDIKSFLYLGTGGRRAVRVDWTSLPGAWPSSQISPKLLRHWAGPVGLTQWQA